MNTFKLKTNNPFKWKKNPGEKSQHNLSKIITKFVLISAHAMVDIGHPASSVPVLHTEKTQTACDRLLCVNSNGVTDRGS